MEKFTLGIKEQHRGVAMDVYHGDWLNFRKGASMRLIDVDKLKKDRLWLIHATTKDKKLIPELNKYNIKYTYTTAKGNNETYYYTFSIYSKTQEDSEIIKTIFNNIKIKYSITEIDKSL